MDDTKLEVLEAQGKEFKFESETNELGVEVRGIERVLPEDRHHTRVWENFTMWCSSNMCMSTLTTGALGVTIYGTSLAEAVAVVVVTNAICCCVTAWFSTFGPRLGMRQFIVTRYSFGWYPTKFVAVLNAIACIGWSVVNAIASGLILESISGGKLPAYGGILILAFLTIVIGIFGYKWVHLYNRFSFIPLTVIFLIVLWQASPYIVNVPNTNQDSFARAGAVMSYIASVVGFAAGWFSFVADYNCNMPVDTNLYQVFFFTFAGLYFPMVLLEIIGLLVGTTISFSQKYADAFAAADTPGVVSEILKPLGGFGTFCMVLLAMSSIATNIPNDYSFGLTMQVLGPRFFMKIKRYWWTLAGSALYVVLACIGAHSFSQTLSNFLLAMGYWGTIYATIVLTEDLLFRRMQYDVHAWNSPEKLPHGIAAACAFVAGAIGAIMGMAQVWFVGPVAAKFGPLGGDLGCELGVVLAFTVYAIARPLEERFTRSFRH
ncbi:hypothetical protein M427DRAFT_56821 [Gonapodya prolifera JEL478]|uniref:Purine-cytosine permease n=1 Tax=Gonapodya prolifera (strain JEL478) TaxID=1344416 RepID=A0A139AFE7_GONPJ|nr:hypothetical protein M427DRAFT_56821 [Gonapodya prolifera JEL478]|eukprot:KXS15480.1 hypothetical protein M427DRAFT_56821 [Gonapodya prolifera JEL478]